MAMNCYCEEKKYQTTLFNKNVILYLTVSEVALQEK